MPFWVLDGVPGVIAMAKLPVALSNRGRMGLNTIVSLDQPLYHLTLAGPENRLPNAV